MTLCAGCGHSNSDAARFCEACGDALGGGSGERRKVVTVLFCDVVGSTGLGEALDPEALRALLARYFERMRGIVESHGGTVEKFIGDAVMAVFGVPLLHEDDALRAVRAALEMREALPALGLEGRVGLTTGEVVAGTWERLVTGDAVNVAARLEQAAQPGEVLIGAATLELVRGAVEVEPAGPLALPGKQEPVPAYRLLALRAAVERRAGGPLVGRLRERRQLEDAFANLSRGRCQLFTILGEAGVGKSRLTGEFLAGLDATVARGRCLSYGEGITYWPVVEVLRQLPARPADPAAAAAIASLLGASDRPAGADEIAWAFRVTLEQAAAERPLVAVFDDIHWGEPAFLDLVEHVADLSRGAAILLLCMARPELHDRRPGWAGGKLNATTVLLEPLSPAEADELIGGLAPVEDELRARIRAAAGGNPLFLEEMLAVVVESESSEVVVPPTIQALLAARLDGLDAPERAVLERGAVEGEIFHRGAVEALAPDAGQAPAGLAALVRKELIRPDRSQHAGDEAYRFHHLLLRDAAYDALPKATRAQLHERLAGWLERSDDVIELDELVGYHLEQACRYQAELGHPPDSALAAAAQGRLAAAGRRALLREDPVAASNLLTRAAALLPPDELDLALELELVFALEQRGDTSGADRAASIAERSAAAGDRVAELCGRIEEILCRRNLEREGAREHLTKVVKEALPLFEAAGDDLALATAYFALGQVAFHRLQMDATIAAVEQSLVHAHRIGLAPRELRCVVFLTGARLYGPTPVAEVLAWLAELEARGLHQSWIFEARAFGLAMAGRLDEARTIMARLRSEATARGVPLEVMRRLGGSADLALLAGDPTGATALWTELRPLLEQHGEGAWLSTVAGNLAQALYALDRLDEAEAETVRSAELGPDDDMLTQMLWRQARAKILARRGEPAEAERLANEAVTLGEATDVLVCQGDAYADLAEVLTLAGRREEAAAALERAHERYERKGSLVAAERTRTRLAELHDATP